MLQKTKIWDVRCPQALSDLFPERRGYYYKVTREQAIVVCSLLADAYEIVPPVISDQPPTERCNGQTWYLKNGRSRIHLHRMSHLKTVFHEFYHHLDHYTKGKYDSDDHSGGPSSLAWQFADRLFEKFRHQLAKLDG